MVDFDSSLLKPETINTSIQIARHIGGKHCTNFIQLTGNSADKIDLSASNVDTHSCKVDNEKNISLCTYEVCNGVFIVGTAPWRACRIASTTLSVKRASGVQSLYRLTLEIGWEKIWAL